MRRMPCRSGLIVLVVAVGLLAAAVPCPDDLAVETGASDQCLASRSEDGTPSPAPSICPCACHVALGFVEAVRVAPPLLVGDLLTPGPEADQPAVPALITHPPLA